MKELFEEIRNAASKAVWSRGVELSRGDGVVGHGKMADEISLRVSVPGNAVARKVVLWPNDIDWSCDCKGKDDPCEHVAAAVIAVRRAGERGEVLPEAQGAPTARIGYQFKLGPNGIEFFRTLQVSESVEERLRLSLVSLVGQPERGFRVVPTSVDLAIEVALGMEREGAFSQRKWLNLAKHLAQAENLFLDGRPIKFSSVPTGTVAVVEDSGAGVRIFGEKNPEIDRIFSNGLAICGDELKVISDFGLTSQQIAMLNQGRNFGYKELADFSSVILPELRRKIPVRYSGKNLAEEVDVEPRVVVQTVAEGDLLSVQLAIAYGEPELGYVVEGNFRSLVPGKVPSRNIQLEERLLAGAKSSLGISSETASYRSHDAVEFVSRLGSWRGEVSGTGVSKFSRHPELAVNFSLTDADFELSFVSADASGQQSPKRADPHQVLRGWKNGESLVRLLDGGWAPLPRQWLNLYGRQLSELFAAKEEDGRLPAGARMDLVSLASDLNLHIPESLQAVQRLLQRSDGPHDDYQINEQLAPMLREYQKAGICWIRALAATDTGGILADDMGLGKTVQAIGAMVGKVLVVAPTSVLQNWQREIQKFRPELKSCLYHGQSRQFDQQSDVVITSYAILRIDQHVLASMTWDVIILDESQYIKNPESKAAQAAFSLTGKLRLCMTGTPIENRLDELWSQFNFANPGFLGSRKFFQEHYAAPIGTGDQIALTRLRARLQPFVLRRKKSEVAVELPPKTTVVLSSELTESERHLYDGILLSTRQEVLESLEQGGSVLHALELLLRLRQAACHPALVPGQVADSSSKIEVLMEVLDTSLAAGSKTIIFSQWTSFLDKIEVSLEKSGIAMARIDGSTSNRQQIVDRFQNDATLQVLLISLKAGGTGLNLTAADQVIIMDPWWNPFVEDQAADRAHRIGQTNPVLVQKVVAKGTVEEKILELQEAKRRLAEGILSGGSAALSLTREDLISLLR